MEKLQLNLTILLPEMDASDDCVDLLTARLGGMRGIEQAHIVRENGTAALCLHYDPNLVPLARLERVAAETGASITEQYRHQLIPFTGLDAADNAQSLAQALQRLPGMLHASVNYAAGLIAVAYDRDQLEQAQIDQLIRRWGARPTGPVRPQRQAKAEIAALPTRVDATGKKAEAATGTLETPQPSAVQAEQDEHDHGSAPGFLPHWVQERWTLLLVAVAGVFLLIGWVGETFFALPRGIALVCYGLAYVAGGYDVATHALPGLLRGKFDTDVLMLAAAAGAALLGEFAEGAFLLFLFSLGHAGEHYALDRARNAVNALGELMPKTARVRREQGIVEEPVEQLEIGDVVVVPPGDRVPVDGDVMTGSSTVDQSPITGESVPVSKQTGDSVFAGTINQEATLDIRTTALARDNTLSRVMQLVQEAQSQQSPTQQFTQRFTRWFVPAVLVVVLLVIVTPPLVGWMPLSDSFYRAMLLLVAASPCALAIGTPATVLAGIAQAARQGVLIKGGVHLENLGRLKVMAFDKTGTLTEGRFQVADIIPMNGTTETELLAVTAAVEQQSNHPLAQAVVRAAEEQELALPQADGMENVAGKGVSSRVNGESVLIGTLRFLTEQADPALDETTRVALDGTLAELEQAGKSTMVVSQGGRVLGVLALADEPRANVQQTLQRLLELGIERLVMLTGDNEAVAQRIGTTLGVTDVRAELLPEHKLAAIRELEAAHGSIAMTGDGVNDAPALATATVGIAMGGAGTAVALETADVALMADDLGKLPFAVGLSRASRGIIQQNLAISLGIIGLLIVTSVLGWVQLSGAVVLHEGSTIVVVLNALRLLAYRK